MARLTHSLLAISLFSVQFAAAIPARKLKHFSKQVSTHFDF
jgi:hypothetical protein